MEKEGRFLKQALVFLDYYRENPPARQSLREDVETLSNFLEHTLHILKENDQDQF